MTAIDKMVEWLENTLVESKRDVKENRQYGINSAGFNAYLGRMEKTEEILEEARRLAQEDKAEAPASLVEELQDALDHDNGRTLWRCRLIEILSRYRPEHMDEGLREEMRKIADMGSCVGFKDLSIRGVIRELLSRHPAPKDRCEELVERLRRYANAGLFDGDTGGDSLIKVLSEFSKEAGKEGR